MDVQGHSLDVIVSHDPHCFMHAWERDPYGTKQRTGRSEGQCNRARGSENVRL